MKICRTDCALVAPIILGGGGGVVKRSRWKVLVITVIYIVVFLPKEKGERLENSPDRIMHME